jgi:serine/threonine protein kinase
MPQAGSTLRSIIGRPLDADRVQGIARLFVQACLGVSCLHTHHVIHRDLKPENILISRDGSAWIADLDIAHIDPGFVSVGLRTMAAEKLLNRDYYAPEQRFGDHAMSMRGPTYTLWAAYSTSCLLARRPYAVTPRPPRLSTRSSPRWIQLLTE